MVMKEEIKHSIGNEVKGCSACEDRLKENTSKSEIGNKEEEKLCCGPTVTTNSPSENFDRIKEKILKRVNPKFEKAIEDISSNEEWYELHDRYIDEIQNLTIQETKKQFCSCITEHSDKNLYCPLNPNWRENLELKIRQEIAKEIFEEIEKNMFTHYDKDTEIIWYSIKQDDWKELKKKFGENG